MSLTQLVKHTRVPVLIPIVQMKQLVQKTAQHIIIVTVAKQIMFSKIMPAFIIVRKEIHHRLRIVKYRVKNLVHLWTGFCSIPVANVKAVTIYPVLRYVMSTCATVLNIRQIQIQSAIAPVRLKNVNQAPINFTDVLHAKRAI